jgi:hypothetical protein
LVFIPAIIVGRTFATSQTVVPAVEETEEKPGS